MSRESRPSGGEFIHPRRVPRAAGCRDLVALLCFRVTDTLDDGALLSPLPNRHGDLGGRQTGQLGQCSRGRGSLVADFDPAHPGFV